MDFIISRRQMLKLGAGAAMLGLAGCGSSSDGGSDAAATDDVTQLTFEPGKLTVATGNPAWEPWVMNDDPESGEGFEAALVYALAEQMGFAKEDVVWVRTDFGEAFAPGEHDWDLNIQQVSISEERQAAVDFSPAYFTPTQAVIVSKGGKYENATSCADLADAVIAVMTGTTADAFVMESITNGSDDNIRYYNDNVGAATDLKNQQIDALVTDTPQCVYMVESGQTGDSLVVGQIPGSSDAGLGMTLAKDSPLTPFVTDAMNAILDDGTVQGLIDQWLAAYTSDIPTLA